MEKNIFEIGLETGSDKIHHHGYHHFYCHILEFLRSQKFNMLEIGMDRRYSLNLWLSYFSKAYIYGIDINYEHKDPLNPRCRIFQCDQNDIDKMHFLLKDVNSFKLIIDDGSHVPEMQLSSFNYLFNFKLENGGIYIIEDIETSYWSNGEVYGNIIKSGYKNKNSCVEVFKYLVDIVNSEFLLNNAKEDINTFLDGRIFEETYRKISTITFGHNCIIIRKKEIDEYHYCDRKYRFSQNL